MIYLAGQEATDSMQHYRESLDIYFPKRIAVFVDGCLAWLSILQTQSGDKQIFLENKITANRCEGQEKKHAPSETE